MTKMDRFKKDKRRNVMRLRKRIFLGMALSGLLGMTTGAWAGEVNLSAAASLKESLNEIADAYCLEHSGTKIIRNFGGSGALAKQVEAGVPADIFISANSEWLDYLKTKKVVEAEGATVVVKNVLVLVGGNSSTAKSMADLAGMERIAIGSPKSVPAGEYALQALKNAGVFATVEKKLIQAKDVREALLYAERGEVDGAFVYRTDALLSKKTKILFVVPAELYAEVIYPMGLTSSGVKNPEAKDFYKYLQSGKAREILGKYGFVLP
jgi:molybdate transport system substrate-binding protein